MDLEAVAKEALKAKVNEIFDEILVTAGMEGKDIVIRISLPSEIMKEGIVPGMNSDVHKYGRSAGTSNLDKEAQAAADELLGTGQGEA